VAEDQHALLAKILAMRGCAPLRVMDWQIGVGCCGFSARAEHAARRCGRPGMRPPRIDGAADCGGRVDGGEPMKELLALWEAL